MTDLNGAAAPVRGRPFKPGNPGRKKGSQNRTSQIAAALLEEEAPALVSKAVELGKAGDPVMLKFLLGRILPREPRINVDLPRIGSTEEALQAFGTIFKAVSEGYVSLSEASALAMLLNSYTRTLDLDNLIKRMEFMEAEIRGEV
jgi:hypothetical protein